MSEQEAVTANPDPTTVEQNRLGGSGSGPFSNSLANDYPTESCCGQSARLCVVYGGFALVFTGAFLVGALNHSLIKTTELEAKLITNVDLNLKGTCWHPLYEDESRPVEQAWAEVWVQPGAEAQKQRCECRPTTDRMDARSGHVYSSRGARYTDCILEGEEECNGQEPGAGKEPEADCTFRKGGAIGGIGGKCVRTGEAMTDWAKSLSQTTKWKGWKYLHWGINTFIFILVWLLIIGLLLLARKFVEAERIREGISLHWMCHIRADDSSSLLIINLHSCQDRSWIHSIINVNRGSKTTPFNTCPITSQRPSSVFLCHLPRSVVTAVIKSIAPCFIRSGCCAPPR